MQTTTFTAPDIVCGGCANAIQKALGAKPGVAEVSVDIAHKCVTVTHEEVVFKETLSEALGKAGFPGAS